MLRKLTQHLEDGNKIFVGFHYMQKTEQGYEVYTRKHTFVELFDNLADALECMADKDLDK